MKKFVQTFLTLVVIFIAGLAFTGCGEDNTSAKKNLTVTISCAETVTAYGVLPELSASATCEGEEVAGKISWDANQEITVDKTTYTFTFIPTDNSRFYTYNGSKTLTVEKAVPTCPIDELEIDYADAGKAMNIQFLVGEKLIDGTLSYTCNSSIVAGEPQTANYTFSPADTNCQTASGTIMLNAKHSPVLNQTQPLIIDRNISLTELETKVAALFEYNGTPVDGTCKIAHTSLNAGKNTLACTFEPQNSNLYFAVSDNVAAVAFNYENNNYCIETTEQLLSIGGSNYNFTLINDLTVTSNDIFKATSNPSYYALVNGVFLGTLDGNGHQITIRDFNLESANTEQTVANYGSQNLRCGVLFEALRSATLKNLTINTNNMLSLCGVVQGTGDTNFENVTIIGSTQNAINNFAPFALSIRENPNVFFNNCTNNFEIFGYGSVSGFVGTLLESNAKLFFNSCTNASKVAGENAGLFVANCTLIQENNITLQACNNSGNIVGAINSAVFGKNSTISFEEFNNSELVNSGSMKVLAKISTEFGFEFLSINKDYDEISTIKVVAVIQATDGENDVQFAQNMFDAEFGENLNIKTKNVQKVLSTENFVFDSLDTNSQINLENGNYLINVKGIINKDAASISADSVPYAVVYCYNSTGNLIAASNPLNLL